MSNDKFKTAIDELIKSMDADNMELMEIDVTNMTPQEIEKTKEKARRKAVNSVVEQEIQRILNSIGYKNVDIKSLDADKLAENGDFFGIIETRKDGVILIYQKGNKYKEMVSIKSEPINFKGIVMGYNVTGNRLNDPHKMINIILHDTYKDIKKI